MATGSFWASQRATLIRSLSREPFQDELTKWLEAAPSVSGIQAFALKSPDRWAQGVAVLTRAAGFTDRQEVQHTGILGLVAELQSLSDAQLEARLRDGVTRSPATSPPKALASGSPASSPLPAPPENHSTNGPGAA